MVQPFKITNTLGSYDVKATVVGGGIAGQADAVRHGITRALVIVNPDYRLTLKRAGFIKRDPRVKERKKYGQKGAPEPGSNFRNDKSQNFIDAIKGAGCRLFPFFILSNCGQFLCLQQTANWTFFWNNTCH